MSLFSIYVNITPMGQAMSSSVVPL
uniref:Uncharacterized protein n=1 Tax=Anguilla anguilla TaxID=7936 RepID=A0A0E9UI85_ANGAN